MNENNNSVAEGLVTEDEIWNEFFDPDGDNPLGLSQEQSNQLKNAIENLCYDNLYRPLLSKFDKLEKATWINSRILIIVLMIQLFLIAVLILQWVKA